MTNEASSAAASRAGVLRVVGCTVVARNYLSYARVVGDGWIRFHAGHPFVVLVIDDDDERPAPDARRRFLAPCALGISPQELERLRAVYGVAELTSALKPYLLRFLLGEGADAVVYVDSDTDIHGSVDHVALMAARSGVALSPNVLEPIPLDGCSPSELDLARVGMYNSGFIAVGSRGGPFLDWWATRLRWDCLFAEDVGLHADQRWLDWVPLYFDHAVIRDSALNVAQWNLHERRLATTDGVFTVNGAPLRSFHFAGFDPLRSGRLSWYQWHTPLRVDFNDAVLGRLCQQYANKLLSAGYHESRNTPYRYDKSASGSQLGRWERNLCREALLAADSRGDASVPSPFDRSRASEFENLLTNPQSTGLLSQAALTRLEDSRIMINGGGWDRRRITRAVRGTFARVRRASRPPWMPHPAPSDRTRAEYEQVTR